MWLWQGIYVWNALTMGLVLSDLVKPEGRGFEIRWGDILNLRNASGRTMPRGLLSL
jgi:hypothetical protein